MFDLLQHAALVIGVLHLLHLDHLGLFQHFDGIEALIVLRLHEMDTTKAAGSQGALKSEVLKGVFALCRAHSGRGLSLSLATVGGSGRRGIGLLL